ncbi:hypothetical protein [Rhodothermus profundi]|uniref:Uncharacterized protein n=1 Tax=Rhodothermus profundi TaxID=633813 RepID=A0A1M6SQV3_9BACT|nr:hypothetical protein [Rhodothermus profundi]SHK47020.1 hypothetical protein SAMN04488087_1187 [Rhodothermus profundi]
MRRLLSLLFAAFLTAGVLSACGQRAAEQAEQAEQPAMEQQEAPAADTLQQDTTMVAPDTAAAEEM